MMILFGLVAFYLLLAVTLLVFVAVVAWIDRRHVIDQAEKIVTKNRR